jgi:hypothetical protein
MGPLSQVSGFTFVVNPSTAMICTASPFFTNVSLVALQYSPFTKTFQPLASIGQSALHCFSHLRFFADLNLQTAPSTFKESPPDCVRCAFAAGKTLRGVLIVLGYAFPSQLDKRAAGFYLR